MGWFQRSVPFVLFITTVLASTISGCSGSSSGGGSADDDVLADADVVAEVGGDGDSDILDAGDGAGDLLVDLDGQADSVGDIEHDGDGPGDSDNERDGDGGLDEQSDADGGAGGVLEGDPDTLAINAIPDLDPPAHPEDGWLDLDGFPLSGVRLVAVVDPEATVDEVNGPLSEIEAELVGGSPVAEYVIVDIAFEETGDRMGWAFTVLDQSDAFLAVGVDQPSESLSLAEHARDQGDYAYFGGCDRREFPGAYSDWEWTSEDSGSSWGLKATRVPFAWNLRDRMVRVADYPGIAIVDDGYWLGHDDLQWGFGTPEDAGAEYHGTGVASMIGSLWGDSGGIEGVLPIDNVHLNMTIRGYKANGDEIAELRQLENIIRNTDVQVLNYSKGRDFFLQFREQAGSLVLRSQVLPTDRRIRVVLDEREFFYTPRSFADGMGAVFDLMIDNLARKSRNDFVITCAAGNMGMVDSTFRDRFVEADRARVQLTTYLARDTSPCTNAAVMHSNPHLLAVEALGPPGDGLARLSNRSGNIAAPGACVGMAMKPGTYGGVTVGSYVSSGGSSFAAPFVAGVAALLWTLDPGLTIAELRTALFESADEGAGDSGPRVNVFAAARYLDTINENQDIQRALVDVDDGTPDGNTRVTLAGEADRIDHHTDGGELGDGCIDMRDFRALRDAIIESADPGTDELDGEDDHPKRDLNRDGYLHHATAPRLDDGATDEEDWSRFDFNGDMNIDGRDVEVMMAVWGSCRTDDMSPQLEGVNANSLAGLVSSADIWVSVPTDNPSMVSVTGATSRRVDPATATDLIDGRLLITTKVACSTIEVCVRELDDTPSQQCQVLTDVAAGNDIQVAPTSPVGDPSNQLVFHTDGALYDDVTVPGISITSPPSFSSRSTHVFWGFRPVLRSPDGRFVASEAEQDRCLDERSAGYVVGDYCVSFMDLAGGDNTVMHLGGGFEPPTHTHLHAWQFSRDGGELLVRGSPAFGDESPLIYHFIANNGNWDEGWRWRRLAFEVDKNPNDNPAMSEDGWIYFAGADGNIHRIDPTPGLDLDYFVGDFAFDVCPDTTPVSEQLTDTETTDTIAQVLPSPISVEGDVMIAVRDGDDWHVDIMNSGGTERTRVVEYFEGRPTYNIVWAPTGRRIAYTSGGWTKTIELGRYGLPDEHEIIISNLGFYTGNLSWSPDGAHIMVYQPGGYTLDNYTFDSDSCGTDPRDLHGFDDLGLVLVVDSISGTVVELQCNVDGQGFPTWSADGKYIALTQEFTDTIEDDDITHTDVVVVAIPSGTKTRATEAMTDDISGVRNDQYDPTWGLNIIP